MGDEQAPLAGPDLTQGVPAATIMEGTPLLGHANGEPVLLTRIDGIVLAVAAHCTHYSGPLNEGLIIGDTIRCPWHHATFNLRTGEMLRAPGLNDLTCWNTTEHEGTVTVTGKRDPRPHPCRAVTDLTPKSVIILGGGPAGAFAADTLRREGYDGPIAIIDAGPSAPYDRPNLSKDYLDGRAPEEWIPLRPDSYYTDNRIDLLLNTRVTAIDAVARHVVLDNGSTREFGALLLATGASPVTLNMPDAGQPIYYLRTLDDSRAIIKAATNAKRAVVIGASFIGLEAASSLRARGIDVTVVGPEARPLERILGPEFGDFIRALHEEHGVVFRLGQTATAIDASSVTLQNGEQLPTDLVVAGIGVRPNLDLAASAGIAVDRGIAVDEYLETNVPGIYAAGDIARWPYAPTGERIRVEHWVVAGRQAQTAARNMIAASRADRKPFDAIPFFWSQHYDVAISYVGHAEHWDAIEFDGTLADRNCTATYKSAGKSVAVVTVYRDQDSLRAEAAMELELAS